MILLIEKDTSKIAKIEIIELTIKNTTISSQKHS